MLLAPRLCAVARQSSDSFACLSVVFRFSVSSALSVQTFRDLHALAPSRISASTRLGQHEKAARSAPIHGPRPAAKRSMIGLRMRSKRCLYGALHIQGRILREIPVGRARSKPKIGDFALFRPTMKASDTDFGRKSGPNLALAGAVRPIRDDPAPGTGYRPRRCPRSL